MDLTVKSALTKGIEAHKAGQLQEADKFYTAILKVQPTHPDANHNMGVLAVGVGKVEESIPFFETALKSNSTITQFWLSYIDALTKLGRLDDAQAAHDDAKHKGIKGEALDKLQATISDKKGFSSPNMLNTSEINKALHLAKKYARDGLFDKAQSIYKDILHKFPKNKRAVQGLKRLSDKTSVNEVKPQKDPPKEQLQRLIIQFNQGQLQQVLEEVELLLEDFQNSVVLYNLKGAINAGLKKFDIAIASYKQAIKIKPDYAEAHCNLANAFRDMGDPENAIRNYKKAIKIKPNFAEAYNNLGLALYEKGNFQEAKKNFEYAIKNRPNFAEAHSNLGGVFGDTGYQDKAIDYYKSAIRIKPNFPEAHNNLGNALLLRGDLKAAKDSYGQAIRLRPDYVEVHKKISSLKTYKKQDQQFLQMKKIYEKQILSEDKLCQISFALGKAYEDLHNFSKSFYFFKQGNVIRKKLLGYNISHDIQHFEKLKKTGLKLRSHEMGIISEKAEVQPIFIVGMPRSGTTLVEQIISSHSNITGAGELDTIHKLGANMATNISLPAKGDLLYFRKVFLSELRERSLGCRFVVDKMPQNFRYIGLICSTFPEAKIIHVKRNATATCWSNYKHYFPASTLGYSHDLNDLVVYYNLYRDLMELWYNLYEHRIYTLDYDKLVSDQKKETEILLKYLEVQWEDSCLSPHKNPRIVKTASNMQVRKKVYTGSSKAWQKFKPFLEGVFDRL